MMTKHVGVSNNGWVGMTEEAARAKAKEVNLLFRVGSMKEALAREEGNANQ